MYETTMDAQKVWKEKIVNEVYRDFKVTLK